MKSYNKWAIFTAILAMLGGITGCGNTSNNSTHPVLSSPPSQNGTTSENSSAVSEKGKSTTSNVGAGITYSTYHNRFYDFTVDYPSNWRESPRPTDGDGRSFTFNTQSATYSNMMDGYEKHDAVIVAVGSYNVANWTYEEAKKEPKDSTIISYSVAKMGNGWETKTVQKKGIGLWYTLQYGDKTYVKTLQVLIPDSSVYSKIAMRVLRSYKPV